MVHLIFNILFQKNNKELEDKAFFDKNHNHQSHTSQSSLQERGHCS